MARQRIVDAADELFSARGFDAVSVSDIAARAEVGRSTFFRYFGDKTEVVFAQEQAMLDAVAALTPGPTGAAPTTLVGAIEQLQSVVLDLCRRANADPRAYRRHLDLLAANVELQARSALKDQLIADRLSELLVSQGASPPLAVLAAQSALACYQTAVKTRGHSDGWNLEQATRAAFVSLLTLHEQ